MSRYYSHMEKTQDLLIKLKKCVGWKTQGKVFKIEWLAKGDKPAPGRNQWHTAAKP